MKVSTSTPRRLLALLAAALVCLGACAEPPAPSTPRDAVVDDASTTDDIVGDRGRLDAGRAEVGLDAGRFDALDADDAADPDVPLRLPPDADWLLIPVDTDAGPLTDRGCAVPVDADPTLPAPRPLSPFNATRVTSIRPTMTWELPPGVTEVRVELCQDACCTRPIRTLDVTGDRVRPTEPLPPGLTWWRLRSRVNGRLSAQTGPTWNFLVGRRDTPVDTYGGRTRDFDGDGWPDLLGWGSGGMRLYRGGPEGLRAEEPRVHAVPAESHSMEVGDFNGDGISDLTMISRMGVHVWLGGRDAWREVLVFPNRERTEGVRCNSVDNFTVADLQGDGFSDLVLSVSGQLIEPRRCSGFTSDGIGTGLAFLVHFGGVSGVATTAALRVEVHNQSPWVFPTFGAGDTDGDGREDMGGCCGVEPASVRTDSGDPRPNSGAGLIPASSVGPTFGRHSCVPADNIYQLQGGLCFAGIALGDLDGDRRGDVAFTTEGVELHLVQTALGLTNRLVLRDPLSFLEVLSSYPFARNLAPSIDINGDGYFDLLVAAPGAGNREDVRDGERRFIGRAFVWAGGRQGITAQPTWTIDHVRHPNGPSGVSRGFANAFIGMGDLDGDGYDDAVLADDRPHDRVRGAGDEWIDLPYGYGFCLVRGGPAGPRLDLGSCRRNPYIGNGREAFHGWIY